MGAALKTPCGDVAIVDRRPLRALFASMLASADAWTALLSCVGAGSEGPGTLGIEGDIAFTPRRASSEIPPVKVPNTALFVVLLLIRLLLTEHVKVRAVLCCTVLLVKDVKGRLGLRL